MVEVIKENIQKVFTNLDQITCIKSVKKNGKYLLIACMNDEQRVELTKPVSIFKYNKNLAFYCFHQFLLHTFSYF
jgi:hypothetical protein